MACKHLVYDNFWQMYIANEHAEFPRRDCFGKSIKRKLCYLPWHYYFRGIFRMLVIRMQLGYYWGYY